MSAIFSVTLIKNKAWNKNDSFVFVPSFIRLRSRAKTHDKATQDNNLQAGSFALAFHLLAHEI